MVNKKKKDKDGYTHHIRTHRYKYSFKEGLAVGIIIGGLVSDLMFLLGYFTDK
jgi:hypothetical protein